MAQTGSWRAGGARGQHYAGAEARSPGGDTGGDTHWRAVGGCRRAAHRPGRG